jgi:pimeloyl-ACP methyl ester carboxylesterase
MDEEPFVVDAAGVELSAHRGGSGPPALLLHGGPALADYLGPLAEELGDTFSTVRYTQRGTPPSAQVPPYSIETHMRDALGVLDALELPRGWVVGHSWGGHLALHLLVNHPDRLLGVVCVGALGAFADVLDELGGNLRAALSAEDARRIDAVEALRSAGKGTERDLVERWRIIWPLFFIRQEQAPPSPERVGFRCSVETNASLRDHFARGTLASALPGARHAPLFVHGEHDLLPARSASETAALIPGSRVVTVPDCAHFPWLERPGCVRDAVREQLDR